LFDLLHGSLGENLAGSHDHHVVAETGHQIQIVLDDAEGAAPLAVEILDKAHQIRQQGAVDAGPRFIQQDHPRIGHQGTSQFQEFFLPAGKGDGQLIPQMDQVQPFQNLFRPSLQVAFLSLHLPPTEPSGE
jgi:hypothetical protein